MSFPTWPSPQRQDVLSPRGAEARAGGSNSAPEWSDDLPASGDPVTAAMALPYGLGAFLQDGPPLLKVASSRHPLAVDMIFGFSQPSSQGWEKSSCPLPLP